MTVHKKNETDEDFFRAHHFTEGFCRKFDYDPIFQYELFKTYVHMRTLQRLVDAVDALAQAMEKK